MALTGNVGQVASAGAYQHSFGMLADRTVVSKIDVKSICSGQPTMEIDNREFLKEKLTVGLKALNTQTGGAGTAGYAMIPVYLDPKIVDITRKNTPIVETISRVTNMGVTADYNRITAKGGAYTAAEDAALPETNTTTERASEPIKYLYSIGRVTGQAIAAYPPYIMAGFQPGPGAVSDFSDQAATNAKQFEILVKTREIRELEENLIINGNKTTSAIAGNPNGTEFDGIIVQMGATNTVDKDTTALALDDIEDSIKLAFDDGGRPNICYCSSGVFTDLMKLLTAKIGYLQSAKQVSWGFSTIVLNTMVGEIPVIPSMFMSNVSGSKAAYFMDLSVVEMRVLQDLTYQDLSKSNDSDKFMLKMYECLIIRAPSYCCSITEISA